ncbi:unannotated protein [freshwater metagenome]|uniref:Unannotated protein n=1 Tax=freshwater metagenome TaxID=449393 RepID=A0A6J7INB1_9ZZZZ|nr:hypothetical protein [Actinomycetota bacterium]
MRSRQRFLIGVTAALATVLGGAGVAQANVTLATGLPAGVKVSMSQRGTTIAWSAPTGTGRWKLILWRNGVTSDVPIATSNMPFDVDLGDDGHGHLLATYSRCSRVTIGLNRPRGCDPYRYDISAQRERRITGLGGGGNSDYLPTASGGRIAFARSVSGGKADLYVRGLTGGTLRRQPGGLMNDDSRTGPRRLDLGMRGLAIAWASIGPAPDYDYGAQEARYDMLKGGHRLLARYTQGNVSGTNVAGVTAIDAGGGVLWGAQGNGEDQRSRLYWIPVELQSSDSQYLDLPVIDSSGTSFADAVILTCPLFGETPNVCSVVRLEPSPL